MTIIDIQNQTNKTNLTPPKMWKVILLNDDFTTMDLVVLILKTFFNKTEEQAISIMLDTHKKGKGIAGIYSKDIAETKINQVMDFAQKNDAPLQCNLEPE